MATGEVTERERALELELDRVRFHLSALEQITATLSVAREVEETEALAPDAAREIFFAWWASLYRLDGDEYISCAVSSASAAIDAHRIPAAPVRAEAGVDDGPVIRNTLTPLSPALPHPPEVMLSIPLGERRALMLLGPKMTEKPYGADDVELLRALRGSTAVALRNADLLAELRREASVDMLTGCRNRRGFDVAMSTELKRARRYGRPVSLVLIDIDRFKALNDDFGHPAGDETLRVLGGIACDTIRDTDIAARYGGEEFALILPETEKHNAALLAERLRQIIAKIPEERLPRPVTASFGVASFPDDEDSVDGLVAAADRALYRAKAAGRNRVEVF